MRERAPLPLGSDTIQTPWGALSPEEALEELTDTLHYYQREHLLELPFLQFLYDVTTRVPRAQDYPKLQAIVDAWCLQ